jgi:hypothetical protein
MSSPAQEFLRSQPTVVRLAYLACWAAVTGLYLTILVVSAVGHDYWGLAGNTALGIYALYCIARDLS